jgi:hypothetical protein
MIDGFMFLRTIPFRWQRQVNDRREKQPDERRLTIDARPNADKNSLVISGGVKLEELYVQVQIFNVEPISIAKKVQRPAEAIGWLECLEESGCLAGWFCVGPVPSPISSENVGSRFFGSVKNFGGSNVW